MQFKSGQHIHFVGIGGFGLSAIARILLERGFKISGSDRALNDFTSALARDGATIYEGHDADHILGADMLIISSAIKGNPEVDAAEAAGVPVYKRRDIMASLMQGKYVMAVAGTHGKTTTTAMLTHIMRACGADPSYIVGGVVGSTGTNAGVGDGDVFIVEADEYDNMFLGLRPDCVILTSIEHDHPDFFKTEADMVASFRQFLTLLPEDGRLFACVDSPQVQSLIGEIGLENTFTYGFDAFARIQSDNVRIDADGFTAFDVLNNGEVMGHVRLPVPGKHNVQNALGALGAATLELMGVPGVISKRAYDAMESFKTTGRRFDIRGEVDGVTVIDDYAHHPTAIRTTLEATKMRYPDAVLWAVWQPHTFSRTSTLLDAYALAFDAADHVLITDIYAAREQPPQGMTNAEFAADVASKIKHADVRHTGSLEDTTNVLMADVVKPAIILIMSAGDAPAIGKTYLAKRESSWK